MANRLTMAQIDAIFTLHKTRKSNRKIAGLLEIDRGTVGKYVRQADAQNRPDHPAGGAPPTGSDRLNEAEHPPLTEAANYPRSPGPVSECEPFREEIEAKFQQGLSAVRIHQDLRDEPGFSASYYGVRRFVARLEKKSALPFRRLETLPGEEAQVDFGTGAPVRTPEGKTRRPWIFRIVLCYSRSRTCPVTRAKWKTA
jgi:hypothetical protein